MGGSFLKKENNNNEAKLHISLGTKRPIGPAMLVYCPPVATRVRYPVCSAFSYHVGVLRSPPYEYACFSHWSSADNESLAEEAQA